ncbi:MAG: hypothetical protein GTO54_09720, partial [Nitrososphaeria archaeon]|nr:hypothetical protein [Nitrososphaeria archaeon]
KVIPFVEVVQSGGGFWRLNHYRLQQGAKDAWQLVIPPPDPSDPVDKRQGWFEDAVNMKIPSSETFRLGAEGKARIARKGLLWKDAMAIPWGPINKKTGEQDLMPIDKVIEAIGKIYYLDVKAE